MILTTLKYRKLIQCEWAGCLPLTQNYKRFVEARSLEVSRARFSNYRNVFISMCDPFSNDDNDPDVRVSLRGAEKDGKARNSACIVWIEDRVGGGANVTSEDKC